MGEPLPRDPSSALGVGTLIAGRYRLVSEIGSGAMGAVWTARHVALGNTVAIKFLHRETVSSPDACARFAREARIAAQLGERCRYVVRVTDYGVLDDVGPFLVMEHLRGEELSQRVRRLGRLSLDESVHVVSQLCRALEVAHRHGVVHRDVKPANVFLTRPQTNMVVFVKLMDFGVAKLLGGTAPESGPPSATRVGAVIGTPAYMSPEQLLAQPIDHRSDLWAVATTAYRALTGDLPFGNGTLQEMGVRIVTKMPRAPSELVPGLPPAVDAWMARALAKSPDERFQSASDMATAFAQAAGVELGPALSPALLTTPTPPSEPILPESGVRPTAAEPATVRGARVAESELRRVAPRSHGRGGAIVAAAIAALVGLAIVAFPRSPHLVGVAVGETMRAPTPVDTAPLVAFTPAPSPTPAPAPSASTPAASGNVRMPAPPPRNKAATPAKN
ncbi:MAG: serine/threonine protein kinase [Deltaproteobacteria bacterium]|nr:serine/threonine protein kinase [Deltaproteobacteria bacterium]